ncbi:MAG: bifunctional tRNA (5-methylaminomethyl-2-thiouridine)(34)-methyltransferase MnmD/FAD-dependent 5-carboxymethylaminomethyl-2-thiouridine(34) oxidoreductase MnmC, partial [Ketobacteraceae bacterium]|nr:bifunctional tRNA (5-methylaminomethyl-2-thiouridine)(34)-methyltransferase MnmD/FAD-dependent 5-carboxymethylaminomethyl-2-thiouridine(34) oxidoreductase MnmC [Ketobacteraceae bacterium]
MSKKQQSHKDQHLARNLIPASVAWNEQNTPVSTRFDDVYYSNASGLEESRYVFLNSNRITERWEAMADYPGTGFTIVETGFGTGLNFLATLQAWQESSLRNAHLHFVSIEKFPLTPADLTTALYHWPALAAFSEKLITRYPPLVPGFHRVDFPEYRVSLTLVLDDVLTALPQLNLRADAWYLDGFAPSKNPDMWQEPLFRYMALLSRENTTFATFTAAGIVRRGLQQAGFTVEKTRGFGHKRDMIIGRLSSPPARPQTFPVRDAPWFSAPCRQADQYPETALVIGAGLAGSYTARALAERGISVTVLEQHETIASEASGNPAGITFTKLSPYDTPQNRFYQKAYLYAVEKIGERLEPSHFSQGTDYHLNGVMRFAFDDKEASEQAKLVDSGLWPESFAKAMNSSQCSEQLGFRSELGGFFIKKGGWLTPRELCQSNLDHPGIKVRTATRVIELSRQGQHWHLTTNNGELVGDVLVLANSFGAGELPLFDHLPLRSVRGQITYVPSTEASERCVAHALNHDGYITPAKHGFHCVGATFQPKSSDTAFHAEDHRKNLDALKHAVPAVYNMLFPDGEPPQPWPEHQGRVAFRCQTPDYLPLIGPAPDPRAFLEDYADLRAGKVKKHYPPGRFLPDCFLNLAHGSRGITSALLGAEIIVSQLLGDPAPIDRETLQAIHPARFL